MRSSARTMVATKEARLPVKVGYQATGTAFVMLEVAGRRTGFMVDSGTPFTSVPRRQVEAWGLGAQIQPCDDDYYEGIVHADVVYDSDHCDP